MNVRRGGLGRGLGALIPSAAAGAAAQQPAVQDRADGHRREDGADPVPDTVDLTDTHHEPADHLLSEGDVRDERGLRRVPGASYVEVPVGAVSPNPRQPRAVFDQEAHDELVRSIQEVGLLQPIVVRPTAAGSYQLVMGERRWRAAQAAGLDHLPAIVRHTADDALLRDALLENLHRSQLNPLEEAAAYDQLLKDFGCSQEELAARIGRSRPQISNTIRLLRLPAGVQRRVAAGVLSAGHARALLSLDDPEAQDRLALRIVAEGLSVRAVEEIVTAGDQSTTIKSGHNGSKRPIAPALAELAARLSDRFETRVRVETGRTKGRISIDFASVDDLERIVALLEPSQPAEPAAQA